MWLKGELVCLNCSRFLGVVAGRRGHPLTLVRNGRRLPAATAVRCGSTSLCCNHCGGRAIVDELEEIPDVIYNSMIAA